MYAATPYSVFSVEFSDNSLHRYSKINGLSGTGVNAIAFDSSTGKLIIGYSNGDIDVLKNDLVKNINALKLLLQWRQNNFQYLLPEEKLSVHRNWNSCD